MKQKKHREKNVVTARKNERAELYPHAREHAPSSPATDTTRVARSGVDQAAGGRENPLLLCRVTRHMHGNNNDNTRNSNRARSAPPKECLRWMNARAHARAFQYPPQDDGPTRPGQGYALCKRHFSRQDSLL